MTRSDHADADLFDATQYDESEWESAQDEARTLILENEQMFEECVLAETGLEIGVKDAIRILRQRLDGCIQLPRDIVTGYAILNVYRKAIDRIAREKFG